MIIKKHEYQATEEETKNVQKMGGGQSRYGLYIPPTPLIDALQRINLSYVLQCSVLTGMLRLVLACAVINVSELGAGVVGGVLMWSATSPRFSGKILPVSRSAAP